MSRSVMLARIRRSCAAAPSGELPGAVPAFPSYEDPVARFREGLELAGGRFLDGRGEGQLKAALEKVLEETGAPEIFWESEEMFREHGLPFRIPNPRAFEEGLLVCSFHPHGRVELPLLLHTRRRDRVSVDQIGLTASGAPWGVAETGTVVHGVGPKRGRAFPLFSPAHLVLLSRRNLLMNPSELFQKFEGGPSGSVVTLVTGPSRTADIERTIVIGVHGPARLFLVLLE